MIIFEDLKNFKAETPPSWDCLASGTCRKRLAAMHLKRHKKKKLPKNAGTLQ
jgi:hypothetical protein